jgi:hypothetical protein
MSRIIKSIALDEQTAKIADTLPNFSHFVRECLYRHAVSNTLECSRDKIWRGTDRCIQATCVLQLLALRRATCGSRQTMEHRQTGNELPRRKGKETQRIPDRFSRNQQKSQKKAQITCQGRVLRIDKAKNTR